jgi:hypothetical protein
MTRFEQLSQDLRGAVAEDGIEQKTRVLEQGRQDGYFDGLSPDEIYVIKTLRSDVMRTRYEVGLEQAQLQPA